MGLPLFRIKCRSCHHLYKVSSWRSFFLPPKHEFWILGHILLHQVIEQGLEDVGEVLQLTMEGDGEQGGHVGPVSWREGPLALQSVNELQEQYIV